MAVTTVTSGLTQKKGINYTVITDTSSDWAAVANSTYFYDLGDGLPHFKNSSGDVLEVFSEAGVSSNLYTANGTLTGDRTVNLDTNILTFEGGNTKLIAQNSTANSNSDYILRLRASNDASDRFFVGNGGEVRIGSATNNGTGDKSTHLMWGGDVVTMAGSGNYSILMGQLVSANFSGNDAIGLGRTIQLNNQRQIALGQGITFTGEGTFGMGRTLTSTIGDTNMIGTALTSNGRYSNLMGKYLQSTSTGASIIGNGNTSTGANLVNNTANSLALGWESTTPQHLFSSTGAILGGKVEMNTTTDGFLMPRLTTAQKNAISTPDTNLMVFDTTLSTIERYDGTNWITQSGTGFLGIASTGGDYTYYTTYTLAMASAVSGETVEQFGNITETSNVTITIKDGVSINMNGYTYTTDGSTVGAFYHDDNGYEQTRFQNGTVKHINTGGVSNALSIGGESHMDCTGLIVISDGAYCLNFNTDGVQKGRLIGGSYIHTGGSGYNHIIEGNVYGAYFNTGDGAVRIIGGSLDNCRIDGCIIIASGIISNSRVIGGSYSHAISNEGVVFNTYASSALFRGISNGNNGTVENSTGISNASEGIYSVAGTVNNSRGKSTASYGMYINNTNAYANGCIAESSAAAAIRLNLGKIYNCKAICTFNDPSGDGILITQNNGFEIIDCYATVVNSSAFAVDGTQSGVISGLKGKGMTALIGSTTNTLTNTTDAFGNGLIG